MIMRAMWIETHEAQGRIVVSADGKSRVVTLKGATPKGKTFTNTAVYDKE